MNHRYFTTLLVVLLPIVGLSQTKKTLVVLPTEVKVKVKGVVCSFCAYGVEKNLSKLSFMDKKKLSSKGVSVDIKQQMVSIAIKKGEKVNLQSILEAIKKGGYEAIGFYLNISGSITQSEKKIILKNFDNNQLFELQGKNLNEIKDKKDLKFIVSIIAEKVSSFDDNTPIPVKILEVKEST